MTEQESARYDYELPGGPEQDREEVKKAKEVAHDLVKECVTRDHASRIVNAIINETLSEYTNDENHDRVLFWREVINQINKMDELTPPETESQEELWDEACWPILNMSKTTRQAITELQKKFTIHRK